MTARAWRWRAALAGGVLVLGSGLGALAESAELDALLAGHTLRVANRQGVLSIHLAADHGFDYADPDGARHDGVWRTADRELCLLAAPAGRSQENCIMIPVRRLGARWTAEDSLNGRIVYVLKRRR